MSGLPNIIAGSHKEGTLDSPTDYACTIPHNRYGNRHTPAEDKGGPQIYLDDL